MAEVFVGYTAPLTDRRSPPSEVAPVFARGDVQIFRQATEYGFEESVPGEPLRVDGNVRFSPAAAGAPVNVGADVQVYAHAVGGGGGAAPVAGGDHANVQFSGAGGGTISNGDSYVATPAAPELPRPAGQAPELAREPVRNNGEGAQFFRGGAAMNVQGDTFVPPSLPASGTPGPNTRCFGGASEDLAMGRPLGGGVGIYDSDPGRPVGNQTDVRFTGPVLDLGRDSVVHARALGSPPLAEPVQADGRVLLTAVGEPVSSEQREQRFAESGEPLSGVEVQYGGTGKPLKRNVT